MSNDLDLSFSLHPITKDVTILDERDSIRQHLKILILGVNEFEIPFHPEIGCDLHDLLFDKYSEVVGSLLNGRIRDCIRFHEPRIDNIVVDHNHDNENYIDITLTYRIISIGVDESYKVFIKRN